MMSDTLIYISKVGIVFTLLTLAYFFFFRRLTFHTLNRAVLLSIIPLSLVLPLLNFGVHSPVYYDMDEIEWLEFGAAETLLIAESAVSDLNTDYWSYLSMIYWIGFAVSVVLLVINAIKLFHKMRSSRKIYSESYTVLQSEVESTFSFFKWIFVPRQYNYQNDDPIIKHEFAHIKLLHTYDLLITEFFIAFTWFNPFGFLFRKLMQSVHEFQADEYVLSNSIKKSEYLSLMLDKLMNKDQFSFTSSFKSSTFKNRIEMITKNKSQKLATIRYAVIIPLIAMVLMSFSEGVGTIPSIKPIEEGKYKKVSSEFGLRMHPIYKVEKFHPGIDFSTEMGTPIRATGNGVVSMVKINVGGHGMQIQIDHGSGFVTSYCNLSEFVIEQGQVVKQGELIAYSGNTGRSTGPHLHYEIRLNGKPQDPQDYFKE